MADTMRELLGRAKSALPASWLSLLPSRARPSSSCDDLGGAVGKPGRRNTAKMLRHYILCSKLLLRRDKELQARFDSVDSPAFMRFIDTEAVLYYREIQEAAIPFPPSGEMVTVGGETDIRVFLVTGHCCYEALEKHLPRSRKRLRLLDFGIGCARTTRHFFRTHGKWEIDGCDVDLAAIRYVRRAVPFVNAVVSGNWPPLPYPAARFDCIYSVSVLTHLNQSSFAEWIRELARVSAPSAVFLPTLHGSLAMDKVQGDPEFRQMIGICEEDLARGRSEFASGGFTWLPQPVGSEDIDSEQFGICFLHQDGLSDFVAPYFDVERYLPGEIGGWQDLAVLKRR